MDFSQYEIPKRVEGGLPKLPLLVGNISSGRGPGGCKLLIQTPPSMTLGNCIGSDRFFLVGPFPLTKTFQVLLAICYSGWWTASESAMLSIPADTDTVAGNT